MIDIDIIYKDIIKNHLFVDNFYDKLKIGSNVYDMPIRTLNRDVICNLEVNGYYNKGEKKEFRILVRSKYLKDPIDLNNVNYESFLQLLEKFNNISEIKYKLHKEMEYYKQKINEIEGNLRKIENIERL